MKIYLASFLQPENFGPGTLISITNGDKPKNLIVKSQFVPFIPKQEILDEYYKLRTSKTDYAGIFFKEEYNKQLREFITEVSKECFEQNISPQELLPFEEGDTLCSWERSFYTNYRKILGPYLEKLDYEVIRN